MKFNPRPLQMRSLFFYILLASLLSPAASRGTGSIVVRAFSVSSTDNTILSFWDGESFVSLRSSHVQPSPGVKVAKANPLPVFIDPALGPEGEKPEPAARVPLPEDASHVLLLHMGNNNGFIAVEDDIHRADANDWLFMNFTPSPIAFQVGEKNEPILIPPRSRFSRRVEVDSTRGAPVMAAARVEGEIRTFYSTFWPVRLDRRNLVLFVPVGQDRIQLRRISERIPAPDETN